MKLKMEVSIAGMLNGKEFSAQPGQIIDVPTVTAKAWIRAGHGVSVPESTPVTDGSDPLRDLSIEEALQRHCVHCATRAAFVLRNQPLCARHFRSEMEGRDGNSTKV